MPTRLHLFIPILLIVVAAAAAAQVGVENVEPRVERTVLARALAHVPMDDDQRLISDMLYADYAAALQRVAEKASERADDAGRRRVEDALSGRVFLDPDELRRMRVAVARADLESWEEADGLALALLADTRLALDAEAARLFDLAVRDVRRAMYLAPRRERHQDDAYAGDGIDVIALVAEAAADGGAIEGAPVDRLAEKLEHYAAAIDRHLGATAAAERQGQTALAIARIERNEAAHRAEEQAAVGRWRVQHAITTSAVEAVAAFVRDTLGGAHEAQWRDLVEAETFPRLCRPTSSDRAYDWIDSRIDDATVRAEAGRIFREFAARDRTLRHLSIAIMNRGRLERGVALHPRMDPAAIDDPVVRELYQLLLRNSGQRAALASDATGALEALLTDAQRKQMQADITAAAYGRRRR